MVSEENRFGLYIAVPVYFVLLVLVAVYSHRRMTRMEQNRETDILTGHYLGGRSFGPLIIAGTIFATIFSGYTVVGVPNESFKKVIMIYISCVACYSSHTKTFDSRKGFLWIPMDSGVPFDQLRLHVHGSAASQSVACAELQHSGRLHH